MRKLSPHKKFPQYLDCGDEYHYLYMHNCFIPAEMTQTREDQSDENIEDTSDSDWDISLSEMSKSAKKRKNQKSTR